MRGARLMEKLLKQIFTLGALIGMAFGAYTFLMERPTAVIGELRAEMKREADSIRAEKASDIAALTSKVDSASGNIVQRLEKIDKQLEKMDDRLYEMQRQQQHQTSSGYHGHDGG